MPWWQRSRSGTWPRPACRSVCLVSISQVRGGASFGRGCCSYLPLGKAQVGLAAALGKNSLVLLQAGAQSATSNRQEAVVAANRISSVTGSHLVVVSAGIVAIRGSGSSGALPSPLSPLPASLLLQVTHVRPADFQAKAILYMSARLSMSGGNDLVRRGVVVVVVRWTRCESSQGENLEVKPK